MEENLLTVKRSAYSYPHMQQKLKEHFRDMIIQTEIYGKSNVVTCRNNTKAVLYDFYSHCDLDPEKDKIRITETACISFPTIKPVSSTFKDTGRKLIHSSDPSSSKPG